MSKKPDPFMIDDDNPEWTAEDFKKARSIQELDPDIVEGMKRLRGQRGPQKTPVKIRLTVRIDSDVVDWFRAGGSGYQTRINEALREYIDRQ